MLYPMVHFGIFRKNNDWVVWNVLRDEETVMHCPTTNTLVII